MSKGAKFFLIVILLAIVGLAIYVGYDDSNKENENNNVQLTSGNVVNNVNESNENAIENDINNDSKEQEKVNEEANNQDKIIEPENMSDEDKAKELVKQKWGGSDGVYFSIDNINSNETYVVSVRDSATTKVLEWYTVDVENGKIIE